MANGKTQLVWQTLGADDNDLPEELRNVIAAYEMARDDVETTLKRVKPAPKGKKWVITWKYGVGVALADGNGGGKANYFAS